MTYIVRTVIRSAALGCAWLAGTMAPLAVRAADAAAGSAGLPIASAPLAFRQDAPAEFPLGGAILLALLGAVALLAWWLRRSSGAPAWLARIGRAERDLAETVQIRSSLRLDAQTRLFVVRWRGRDLLVAAGGPSAPVVLDRADAAAPPQSAP